MHTVTSFHASAVEPEQLSAIMADYLALERARIFRRLFVDAVRSAGAVVAIVGVGLHWLPAVATWFSVGLCVAARPGRGSSSCRCDWRLARRLDRFLAARIGVPPRLRKS